MTPDELAAAVRGAVAAAVEAGDLLVAVPASVAVERPRQPEHGDYATSIALQLAKGAGRPPREVAGLLVPRLEALPGISSVQVAGPGFINLRLAAAAQGDVARRIVIEGAAYGVTTVLGRRRTNLEFVSANPTGPVTLGSARWAAVGDSLARLLTASGADVTREYYVNDAGSQIDRFAESLQAAALDEPTPEEGYAGAYVVEVAARLVAAHPELLGQPRAKALVGFRALGLQLMLTEIKVSLEAFGVHFDRWLAESELHDGGALDRAVERLRTGGHVYEAEGATWLATEALGDDRDRVLLRSDGRPTYFTADCAYYLDKRERGFEQVIITLGADHHGYVGRLRAMARAFGDDPDVTLEVLIGQLVNLIRDGQPVKMSKRAGTVVLLEDLVESVGVDAARYSLARNTTDTTIDLDLDLLIKQTSDNPVFYVQYAHARLAGVLRHARELGIERPAPAEVDVALLEHSLEGALLRALAELPQVISAAAELRAPHRVARYLEELVAPAYHRFYDACRVLPMGDEPVTPLVHARLLLCEATRTVLANGLALLGVSAPERM